jgi:non-specific serine/threonine protein kinase/serine/threonine-protein kinase
VKSVAPVVIGGRYELGELLGRGGMAEVYAGVDRRLERPVAIKLLQESMAARPDIRTRFEAEAKAAATLTQPHAVAVFDTGEHEGVPYIVMERLPGNTLADRIAAGPLPPEDVRAIAVQVLGALGAAHAAGIVHRDVKPGNVLVAADGSVKIADFGIAKSIDVASDLTGTGQVLGTPAYLAPEQVEGSGASPSSDLYALGVVLYEALTGQKPFAGPTPVAVAQAVVAGAHRPLAELRPDVDRPLTQAVERAMARDPADRFPSAASMAAALSILPPTIAAPIPLVDDTQTLDATSILGESAEAAPAPAAAALAAAPAAAAGAGSLRRPRPAGPGPRRLRVGPWVVLLAGAALLVLLVLARALGSGGDARRTTSTTQVSALAGLAQQMRAFADGLSGRDGDASSDLAGRMRTVADQVEAGGGRSAANSLVGDVRDWQDNGDLTDRAALTALGLLQRVPGVTVPSTSRTTEAPTTEPPTTEAPPTTIVVEEPTIVITVPNVGNLLPGDGGGGKGKKGK